MVSDGLKFAEPDHFDRGIFIRLQVLQVYVSMAVNEQ